MPHECTTCGRTFPDGSTEMLSGCPDCGGNKFQFRPKARESGSKQASDGSPPQRQDGSSGDGTTGPIDAGSAKTEVSAPKGPEWPRAPDRERGESTSPGNDPDPERHGRPDEAVNATDEDDAQRSARSDVVTPADLPAGHTARTESDGTPSRTGGSEPTDADPDPIDDPDLASLRAELNDQFESIRIVKPGQYELNLMELYDRQEYIISLREDGRYVIEMPDAWDAMEEA